MHKELLKKQAKVTLLNSVKRFDLPPTFDDFKAICVKTFNLNLKEMDLMTISYIDDDEDKIIISSEFDYEQAMIFIQNPTITSLKILLEPKQGAQDVLRLSSNNFSNFYNDNNSHFGNGTDQVSYHLLNDTNINDLVDSPKENVDNKEKQKEENDDPYKININDNVDLEFNILENADKEDKLKERQLEQLKKAADELDKLQKERIKNNFNTFIKNIISHHVELKENEKIKKEKLHKEKIKNNFNKFKNSLVSHYNDLNEKKKQNILKIRDFFNNNLGKVFSKSFLQKAIDAHKYYIMKRVLNEDDTKLDKMKDQIDKISDPNLKHLIEERRKESQDQIDKLKQAENSKAEEEDESVKEKRKRNILERVRRKAVEELKKKEEEIIVENLQKSLIELPKQNKEKDNQEQQDIKDEIIIEKVEKIEKVEEDNKDKQIVKEKEDEKETDINNLNHHISSNNNDKENKIESEVKHEEKMIQEEEIKSEIKQPEIMEENINKDKRYVILKKKRQQDEDNLDDSFNGNDQEEPEIFLKKQLQKLLKTDIEKKVNNFKRKLITHTNQRVENIVNKYINSLQKNKENKKSKSIHEYIRCNGCSKSPIVGDRYKCFVCNDFDYCDECEEKNSSTKEHPHDFIRIRQPVVMKVKSFDFEDINASSEFLSKNSEQNIQINKKEELILCSKIKADITEKTINYGTSEVVYVLTLNNSGTETWKNVVLRCLEQSTLSRYPVRIESQINPKYEFGIEVKFNTDSLTKGAYNTHLRLFDMNTQKFFGDTISLKTNILEPNIKDLPRKINEIKHLYQLNGIPDKVIEDALKRKGGDIDEALVLIAEYKR
jgi:hypothetical protein